MNFYIVGGAVRDSLLDKEPHDFDIVVEGTNPETMIGLGFIPVGKSFPVFCVVFCNFYKLHLYCNFARYKKHKTQILKWNLHFVVKKLR